ncbi:Pimeloyl-[acyl-carrier protein] methyl ester esterase [Falsiruegeria litorea R37]|uniref:Pimeloyl-[acyl-carrier protein] methyl ester esterase n=1 Tax=Falsiruegeria litorea R37 TaxID=1200284 RepID=A0A1Y5TCM8_9RHOB|nr:alpha/beta fold hydrolase [Falsiruegeria litorea]SLN57438.1 Pimeloyl-[acyl-carrier protein] methyl ester esterase [Falsiruegeria litorea R37]
MVEPLVLLPGMMCDARLYAHQLLTLGRDRAVMVAPIHLGERVEEIASGLLDQLPQRFALAGLSMGGIIAMEIYRRAPDRVTRLCLMDTDVQADTPVIAAAREPMIVGAKAGRLDEVLRQAMQPEYLAPNANRMQTLEQVYAMGRDMGAEAFVRQSRALQRRPDQQGTLRKIKVPTLVLCGAHDALTPVKRHTFMAELIPGAELQVIDNAGHLPTLETPDIVTRVLLTWLQRSQ